MAPPQRTPVREERIHHEAVVDAYRPEAQALARNYYLEDKIRFPFQAKCIVAKTVAPLIKGETIEGRCRVPPDARSSDGLTLIRWQGRNLAVPLSQRTAIDADESTTEAIGDWH